ncbi:hypothetical protein GCM10023191_011120 [Actinoallomurus oryzae]|uniref:Uncharacterized protein n=1 Tax=Actinoallomurus oryzae TaxID=502180 RepID=A0ABP8PDS1_9ACTN
MHFFGLADALPLRSDSGGASSSAPAAHAVSDAAVSKARKARPAELAVLRLSMAAHYNQRGHEAWERVRNGYPRRDGDLSAGD